MKDNAMLGLIGLAGLIGRKRDDYEPPRTTTTSNDAIRR